MSISYKKSIIQIARQNGEKENSLPLDLGMRVRELRKARGWTLEQAATQAGLARSTLSKIENGQMSPTYDALKKLKNACGESNYLGYTATSQALYLAHDNSFLRPDSYAVLQPGKNYVGNYEIFGETSHIISPSKKASNLNTTRN